MCLWVFGVNVLAGSLLKSSVFHRAVAGGLAIIEDRILWDLDASRGGGQGWPWGLRYVKFEVGC